MKHASRLLVLVLSLGLLLASWPTLGYAQPSADEPVVEPDFGATGIAWSAPQGNTGFLLVVSGPNDYRFEQTFQSDAPLAFPAVDASGAPLADGLYKYELNPVSFDLTKSRSVGDDGRSQVESRELAQSQAGPSANLAGISGAFTIQNGSILDPNAVEEETSAAAQPEQNASPSGIDAPADQVILDDLIVAGSICAGFDCVNGESFGFDTIRIKENNLRIRAQDTSSSASFPTNDWQLTFNDSSNGGANKFSIDDIDGGRTPFTIEASAPSNSLYVDYDGWVGFGTNNPVVQVHVKDGNTPTVRLEQDGTSGFTAQTWDLASNEANFFIRDATNGSTLPFRIFPGAPSNALVIEASGDVGLGTTSPVAVTASLHVRRTDGTAQILVEEASGTAATRTLLELRNDGKTFIELNDTRATDTVKIGVNNGRLAVILGTTSRLVQSNIDGTLTVFGNLTLSGGSCTGCRVREAWSMPQEELLSLLANVPVVHWNGMAFDPLAVDDGSSITEVEVTHLSPDMQAFYDAYGLGLNGEQVAPLDVAAVSLASVQALNGTIQQQQSMIENQQELIRLQAEQLAAMDARLTYLESMAHSHAYLPSVTR